MVAGKNLKHILAFSASDFYARSGMHCSVSFHGVMWFVSSNNEICAAMKAELQTKIKLTLSNRPPRRFRPPLRPLGHLRKLEAR